MALHKQSLRVLLRKTHLPLHKGGFGYLIAVLSCFLGRLLNLKYKQDAFISVLLVCKGDTIL